MILVLSSKQVFNLKELSNIELVKFEYNKYPSFISEKEEYNQIGSYAWKPLIIKEIIYKYKTQVVWLDSANLIDKKFVFLKDALKQSWILVHIVLTQLRNGHIIL